MPRIEQVQQMLAAEPNDVFLNFSLAMALVREERFDEALAQFGRVLELEPGYVPAYMQKANALVKTQRADAAAETLRQGIATAKAAGDHHAADEMQQMLDLLAR